MMSSHSYAQYLRVLNNATDNSKIKRIFELSVALACGGQPVDKDVDCAQFLLTRRPAYFKQNPTFDTHYVSYLLSTDYTSVMETINKLDLLAN